MRQCNAHLRDIFNALVHGRHNSLACCGASPEKTEPGANQWISWVDWIEDTDRPRTSFSDEEEVVVRKSGSDDPGPAIPVVSVAVGLCKIFISLAIQLSHSCVDLPKRPICCSAASHHFEWSVVPIKLIELVEVRLDIGLHILHDVR
jgi:hypothetical protein